MPEPYYAIVCWLIRLTPLLAMILAWVMHDYIFKNKYGFISAALVGYVVGNLAVVAYWNFASDFAPNEQIQNEIAMKDGAPLAAAPFVLPVYVLFSFVLVAPISLLICGALPKNSPCQLTKYD